MNIQFLNLPREHTRSIYREERAKETILPPLYYMPHIRTPAAAYSEESLYIRGVTSSRSILTILMYIHSDG